MLRVLPQLCPLESSTISKSFPMSYCMTLCPKSSANPITVTPIWKREFANGEHPIRGLYRIFFFEIFFSNFRSHMKDSKWGRKCIFSIVQTVKKVLNKSNFSLQMGNCHIPVAEDYGQRFVNKLSIFIHNEIQSVVEKSLKLKILVP